MSKPEGKLSSAREIWEGKLNFLLREEAVSSDPEHRFRVQQQIAEAKARLSALQEQGEDTGNRSFEPTWSVLPGEVRYVDANLVHQYVGMSADVSIMLALFSLFFGAFASFIASYLALGEVQQKTVLGVVALLTLLTTFVFLFLTIRATRRANGIKKRLFPESKRIEEGDG